MVNSQEYCNLTNAAAGLFHLDPLGEIPQTTSCMLARKWLGMGIEKTFLTNMLTSGECHKKLRYCREKVPLVCIPL